MKTCCGGNTIADTVIMGRGTLPCLELRDPFITNGDFVTPVTFGTLAPLDLDAWNIYQSGTTGGVVGWTANEIDVIANNNFSFHYLYYQVQDSFGALTSYIDRTRDTYFSFDLSAINVRNGKRIILTFQSVNIAGFDSHYYQINLSAFAYGTHNLIIHPSDWIAGSTPAGFGTIGSGTWGAQLVTFFIQTSNAGTGYDDDYSIDNVSMRSPYCV